MGANSIAKLEAAVQANKLFSKVGDGTTLAALNALTIQPGDLIGHQRFETNTVTHIVVVESATKVNGVYTDITIIEAPMKTLAPGAPGDH